MEVSATPDPVPFNSRSSAPPTQLNSTSPDELEQEVASSPEKRVSFYCTALDDFISVVHSEGFLFTLCERKAIERILELDYEAKYLLIRLYLRSSRWLRIKNLEYENDIEDMDSTTAVLQSGTTLIITEEEKAMVAIEMKKIPSIPTTFLDGREVMDLTGDSDEEPEEIVEDVMMKEVKKEGASLPEPGEIEPNYEFIAEGTNTFTKLPLAEILDVLSAVELTQLAKEMKVKKGNTRQSTIEALLATSKQSTLFFSPASTLSIEFDETGRKKNQISIVASRALSMIGQVIRLTPAYRLLLDRASLIYHRTAFVGNATSLTASLLARFGKRTYPEYEISRTYSIFTSRSLLLEYQKALELERKMEEYLGETGEIDVTLTKEEKKLEREAGYAAGIKLYESISDIWWKYCKEGKLALKAEDGLKESEKSVYSNSRFHPGWPLTRIVYKAAAVYGKLHNRPAEILILKRLLNQTSYRRGRRGEFIDRLALLLQNYPSEAEEQASEKKKESLKRKRLEEAKELCMNGLKDPHCHLIYHPLLQRRINRIESALEIEKSQRQNFQSSLKKAEVRTMEGERTDDAESGHKSVWRGAGGAEVSVEQLALEQYQKEAWKGIHGEGGVLTTIFVLLFWDVIFKAGIVGVFQHAFQSAPLDLNSDSFSITRKFAISKRLKQLRAGGAAEILKIADERERARGTWVIGVNWNKFSQNDLLELVECIGGEALAIICQHFCENYAERRGGVPDLCLWDPNDPAASIKFSEIKGPGDSLSNTQDVWIDVLLSAGIPVEICRVMTTEQILENQEKLKAKEEAASKKKAKALNKKKRKASEVASEESE